MCTILTFDKTFYQKNKAAIREQIQSDAFGNGDGFSILTIGLSHEDTNLTRAMNIELILVVLDLQMESESCERAWIHTRMATTGFVGINGCHGFAAKDFTVFHNGILTRSASDGFSVDSELIAWDIESAGVETAIKNLAQFDSYANVFIVNNKTGQYHVIRRIGGTLFTDGNGNYSTNKIAAIKIPVPIDTKTEFAQEIVEYQKSLYGTYHGFNSDSWEYKDDIDLEAETSLLLECLEHLSDIDSFEELAEYEGWLKTGIPWEIYENMPLKCLQWSASLYIYPRRVESAKTITA